MKITLTIFTLTVLCVTLICPLHSFAQNFVDGQMPDTFLNVGVSVLDIKFSPDGTILASGSSDDTIKLWDIATGTLKNTLEGHTDSVRSVAFSPDGTTIASGSYDDTIKLWDVATGTLKTTLEGHKDDVNSVAFSPDGTTIASSSDDTTVILWDVATGTLKATLEGHKDKIHSVAFSPDGTTIASSSDNATVILWDVASGIFKANLIRGPRSWRAREAEFTFQYRAVGYSIESIAFSPDGKMLASGVTEYLFFRSTSEWSIGEFAQIEYGDGPLQVEVNDDNAQTWRWSDTWDAVFYEFSIDLWDVATRKLKATLEGHEDDINSVAFSPDSKTLASGSRDDTVKLWDVTRQPKTPKATLSYHGDNVTSVAFSPDSPILASSSVDGAVRLWRALSPVNADGVVNIADLVEVAQNFGQVGKNNADINGDGIVNVVDLILVAVALGEVAGAPTAHTEVFSMLTAKEVEQWLIEAKQLQTEDSTYLRVSFSLNNS